jgi:hypothetical protein
MHDIISNRTYALKLLDEYGAINGQLKLRPTVGILQEADVLTKR